MPSPGVPSPIRLGIRANLAQFLLLVLINGFVGAMVGLERTVLPLLGEQDFGIISKTVTLSFLVSFGIVKAFSNLLAGRFSEKFGRKKILLIGWVVGIPVPFLLIYAPTWDWVITANLLLGVNQGLCWSATVIMKIDLAGPRQRGLAMGLNEFSGYLAVAFAAYASGVLATEYGLRPFPFYLGIAFSFLGFLLSAFLARDTSTHAELESSEYMNDGRKTSAVEDQIPFKEAFLRTTWKNRNLFSCSQAGMVNNLNDGVAWGLFPLFFAAAGLTVQKIGLLAAIYPATWGGLQLVTGALSDRVGRKPMIVLGMWLQGLAIVATALVRNQEYLVGTMFLLGTGTAMVYPTLLASVSDAAHPNWRASAVGVYRLWRDLGYALGAIVAGAVADRLGIGNAIFVVGLLTFLSGIAVAFQMKEEPRNAEP